MTYKVLYDGAHKCDLPDASEFTPGTMIMCVDVVGISEFDTPVHCSRTYRCQENRYLNRNEWSEFFE